MKYTMKIVVILVLLFLVACSPEAVEVTREVPVEKEVEVTRLVEVTKEVEVVETVEVEVTRLVEVEVETEVEVTRIIEVEVQVTAVPTETPLPPPTNTPAPQAAQATAAPAISLQDELLASMLQTRINIDAYGGMIDYALREGAISCEDIVNTYDAILFAPTYDVNNANDLVKNAYPAYRAAIDVFTTGAFDMTENCRNFLADPGSAGGIASQQWALARQEVGSAVQVIQPAILSLGGE